MRTERTPTDDRAAAVIPPIICNQPDDVAEVTVLGGYRILVKFHDGVSGVVDLSRLVRSSAPGVFAELADPSVFAEAAVALGAVTWPGNIDLAPDSMYQELRIAGEWLPQ